MPLVLEDWPPPEFFDHLLEKLPAPVSPVTRKPMWEKGIRLHGQQRGLVVDPYKFKAGAGGVRFGKSFAPAVAIVVDILWRMTQRGITDDLYGIIGDNYAQAEAEITHCGRLLRELGVPHDFSMPLKQAWSITIGGKDAPMARIVTLTAVDITKIASKPYRGMVMAEAAQLNPDVFDKANERVIETDGWIMMTGTFEKQVGRWYARKVQEWKAPNADGRTYTCPSWDNPLVFPGGREDPRILYEERRRTRARFLEVYGGDPQSSPDLIFPEADAGYHIKRRFPFLHTSFDPDLPVFLFSDPGTAHAYAVAAVQFAASPEFKAEWSKASATVLGREPRWGIETGNIAWVIDAVYRWDRDVEQVVQECASRPWAPNVQESVMDFAANQRRAEGRPVVEQWAKFWPMYTQGRRIAVHADPVPLQPGYDVHKKALINAWPEREAEAQFNADGKIHGGVVNPAGPRLYIDPGAAAPLFGGLVDNQDWGGEYLMHKKRVNGHGQIVSDDPIPVNDDMIKAINYGLYWWFGVGRQKHTMPGVFSVPWEVVA